MDAAINPPDKTLSSYLRSTFTPKSRQRGKRQKPTKALNEDEFWKAEILKDLLTKKLKP